MKGASQKVKEELAHARAGRRCCQMAELSALIHVDGTYLISGTEGHLLVTESSNAPTARKIYTLIHGLYTVETSTVKVSRSTPRRQNLYRLQVPDQPGFQQVLYEMGILDASLKPLSRIPGRITRNSCCVAAALRGAFLGGGYVTEPYGPIDFEISFSSEGAARAFADLFSRKSLEPGLRRRRNHWVLYLKKKSSIAEFLAVTGAHGAYLEWESQTIMSATKNQVNRLVNCDAANARRLAEASLNQREAIRELARLGLLEGLDRDILEAARIRTEYPQASLAELARLFEPPVTKAVVQRRLKRIMSLLPGDAS